MIPKFDNIDAFMEFFDKDMKGDKNKLYAMKKSAYKEADSVAYSMVSGVEKSAAYAGVDRGMLKAKIVVNTTNVLDSHGDVHINGLWDKSISENRLIYHLQEHKMAFNMVISDSVKASAEMYNWKDLGAGYKGRTQALVFESDIEKVRNEFMYEQYLKGYVKNHSVGMRYVKMAMCVDSPDKYWKEEKANWEKYIDIVVNQDEAIGSGMFWAITEAKVIEGSAVLIGSNTITPTIEVSEAAFSTSQEPLKSTLSIEKLVSSGRLINF